MTNLKEGSHDLDTSRPSPVMKHLVECLKYLIFQNETDKKPVLVLNGDILELALSTTNQAAMVFQRFIELILPSNTTLFEKIIYIPGNHDHNIWEIARETQYMDYISKFTSEDYLPIPWHTTKLFIENSDNQVSASLLAKLIEKYPHLENFQINAAYPNFGLISEKKRKCVIFHHGHFIDSDYQLMSRMKGLLFPDHPKPSKIYDIEAENFAWINFFWSTMGRSGEIGEEIETIYEKMLDKEQFRKLLSSFADNLADKYDLLVKWDWLEAAVLKQLFYYLADEIQNKERAYTTNVCSEDVKKGFRKYMEGPLKNQLSDECNQNLPSDVSFVFGHTHKPFQKDMNFRGYPQWVNVYNTGGWVVDSLEPKPVIGGAVVLVDENLDMASIRMYNQADDHEGYYVKVEGAAHPGEPENRFCHRISDMVDPSQEPWRSFSTVVADVVDERIQNLKDKVSKR